MEQTVHVRFRRASRTAVGLGGWGLDEGDTEMMKRMTGSGGREGRMKKVVDGGMEGERTSGPYGR